MALTFEPLAPADAAELWRQREDVWPEDIVQTLVDAGVPVDRRRWRRAARVAPRLRRPGRAPRIAARGSS